MSSGGKSVNCYQCLQDNIWSRSTFTPSYHVEAREYLKYEITPAPIHSLLVLCSLFLYLFDQNPIPTISCLHFRPLFLSPPSYLPRTHLIHDDTRPTLTYHRDFCTVHYLLFLFVMSTSFLNPYNFVVFLPVSLSRSPVSFPSDRNVTEVSIVY